VVYYLARYYLKGSVADELRNDFSTELLNTAIPGPESIMVDHLVAWAQCSLIPMFDSNNKKAFQNCSFRPDVFWHLPGMIVMLECDQNAHSNYDRRQEFERMQELLDRARSMGSGVAQDCTINAVFIRFNPSLKGTNSELKHATLLTVLLGVFANKPEYVNEGKTVIHLFYPCAPSVWYDKCL
jgi:hypothetical protein